TVVSARPSASTLISASAVSAATSTTPRAGSRRRDTDHLHQLAGGPARLRVDANPYLAQRGVQRAADVALEVEAARTHPLAVARRGGAGGPRRRRPTAAGRRSAPAGPGACPGPARASAELQARSARGYSRAAPTRSPSPQRRPRAP